MTKNILKIIVALLVILSGCNLEQPVQIIPGSITTEFQLLDTNGNASTVFHSGEEFDMSFRATNLTGAVQNYSYTPPRFVFWIRMSDSIVCTSTDGLLFAQVIMHEDLNRGQSFSSRWRAPNSSVLPQRIVLQPGKYTAWGGYGGYQVISNNLVGIPPGSMSFTVVP